MIYDKLRCARHHKPVAILKASKLTYCNLPQFYISNTSMLAGDVKSCSLADLTLRRQAALKRFSPVGLPCVKPHNHSTVCRNAAKAQPPTEYEEPYSPFAIKPGFFKVAEQQNRQPDFTSPDWIEKVTDWDDFWNHQRWELETVSDDYVDTSGNFTGTMDYVRSTIAAIQGARGHPEAIDILAHVNTRRYTTEYEQPSMEPVTAEENPKWDINDFRALSEKQRHKELMDIEWRRRQSKVGRLQYPHKDPYPHDVRYRRFDGDGETLDWSHEEMYALITQNGAACRPEDHQAIVENPLINVDFPNTFGVEHIEEVDELLERIGHLAVPEQIQMFDDELVYDLTNGVTPEEVAQQVLVPKIMELDEWDAAEEWRRELNNWTGDD